MAYIRTNYPASLDKNNANVDGKGRLFWRVGILDFEDKTSTTDPMMYHILSNDVKALQEAVFSIEDTLGVMPQSTAGTVSGRIAALEDYTDLDSRYGGATWRAIPDAQRPTIMGHSHDGTTTGASKINVRLHVTDKLQKSNLNLDRTTGVTGADIYIDASTDKTLPTVLGEKFDKTGGTVTGNMSVAGKFNSTLYQEAEAYECFPVGGKGAIITDNGAFSGRAVNAIPNTHAAGQMLYYKNALRYGYYSFGLRLKVSNIASGLPIGKIKIYSDATQVAITDIIPNKLPSTDYEVIYLPFNHKSTGGANAKNVVVIVEWNNNVNVAANLSLDSIAITPMHVAVYDKSING